MKNTFQGMLFTALVLSGVLFLQIGPVVGQSVFPQTGLVNGVSTDPQYNGNLLVLKLPQLGAPQIGFVSNGTQVTVEEQQLTFYRISSPKAGWVWSSYVKLTNEPVEPDPNGGKGPSTADQALNVVKFASPAPSPEQSTTSRLQRNETLVASWARYLEERLRSMPRR